MKTLRYGLVGLAMGFLFVVACGGHPGGSVGDACSVSGTSDECLEDEICDSLDGGDFVGETWCLRICDEHEDCEAGESCNGVSGSNIKGCHPTDEIVE